MAIDNFDRVNNNSLGANWDESEQDVGDLSILTNLLRALNDAAKRGRAFWVGSGAPGPDQYAQIQLTNPLINNARSGLCVRGSGSHSNFTGYILVREVSLLVLRRLINEPLDATSGLILGTFAAVLAPPDVIRLEAQGTNIRAFLNGGAAVINIPDASIAAGSIGVVALSDATGGGEGNWDNFIGGEVAAHQLAAAVQGAGQAAGPMNMVFPAIASVQGVASAMAGMNELYLLSEALQGAATAQAGMGLQIGRSGHKVPARGADGEGVAHKTPSPTGGVLL